MFLLFLVLLFFVLVWFGSVCSFLLFGSVVLFCLLVSLFSFCLLFVSSSSSCDRNFQHLKNNVLPSSVSCLRRHLGTLLCKLFQDTMDLGLFFLNGPVCTCRGKRPHSTFSQHILRPMLEFPVTQFALPLNRHLSPSQDFFFTRPLSCVTGCCP